VDKACEAEGRDPATLDRLLLTGFSPLRPMGSIAEFQDVEGRAADLGFTDLVLHYPREDGSVHRAGGHSGGNRRSRGVIAGARGTAAERLGTTG